MALTPLVVFCVLALLHGGQCSTTFREGTVYVKQGKATFKSGILDRTNGAAFGYFNATILKTGWGVLEVQTGAVKDLSNNDFLFAAGYLEGVLTAKETEMNAHNMRKVWSNLVKGKQMNQVEDWLVRQDAWARSFVKKSENTTLGRTTGYLLSQFDGLLAGVQDTLGSNRFNKSDLLMLVNTGDLIDLSHMFSEEEDFEGMDPVELRHLIFLRGMCSALVKVTPGLENVFMSHVSWFVYSATMRVYKHYNFAIKDAGAFFGKLSFSSYAGYLTSLDDFYILGSKMVVLQTTNNIFNRTLYDAVTAFSLVSWQRVRAANHLAADGARWAEVVAAHNSGTYNNQYMVVDLKRIHLKQSIDDGALTIVEQIPGLVEASDQTPILRNGHWPSYNVPFHERIYNMSGYPDFVRKHGVAFSYQLAPRAELFRRDAGRVTSLADMQRLMRSNDYKHDPYSAGDPMSAICSRGDLLTKSPTADGCYDGKVTDVAMALRFESEAVSGPTTAAGTLPPFSWDADTFRALPHEGLPSSYAFNWTGMRPYLW